MKEILEDLLTRATAAVAATTTLDELEAVDTAFLGRKQGELTNILRGVKDLSVEEKRIAGSRANEIKIELETALAARRELLQEQSEDTTFDISEPVLPRASHGTLHPITQISEILEKFFAGLGFTTLSGPELEHDYFNFEALHIAPDHPARDMQDTFYIKDHPEWLMRTHTSSMQVRALREYGAPLAAIMPGRCYRNEATDVRHEHTFHQMDGFMVGPKISFAELKGVLLALAQHLYGPDTEVRLRPKFYPFVEPGVNGEVTCVFCKGKGCKLCKHTGFLEVFGAGMIHPEVLRAANLNPEEFSGFAFGLGLTRLAMLKYGVSDVRLLQNSSVNFLEQF